MMQIIIYGDTMPKSPGTIKIGKTDGFRYFGFKPPLSVAEFDGLPKPTTEAYSEKVSSLEWEPTSIQIFPDGSMDIGYSAYAFGAHSERLLEYANVLKQYLGNRILDTEIRMVGPGSVTSQAVGDPARY